MENRNYDTHYKISDMQQGAFMQFPKTLLFGSNYNKIDCDGKIKRLSSDAIVLYLLLLDRLEYSKISGTWVNYVDKGNVYIIYEHSEIYAIRGYTNKKIKKLYEELIFFNLVRIKSTQSSNKIFVQKAVESKFQIDVKSNKKKESDKRKTAVEKSKINKKILTESTESTGSSQREFHKNITKDGFGNTQREFREIPKGNYNNTTLCNTVVVVVSEQEKLLRKYGFELSEEQLKLIEEMDTDKLKESIKITIASSNVTNKFKYMYMTYLNLMKEKSASNKKSLATDPSPVKRNNVNKSQNKNQNHINQHCADSYVDGKSVKEMTEYEFNKKMELQQKRRWGGE